MAQWTGCIAGALTQVEFRQSLRTRDSLRSRSARPTASRPAVRYRASVSRAAADLKDPQALYDDWEHAHWASQDIDLSRDPEDWAGLEEVERDLLYFALSSLMVAEERISTQFVGLVLAQDDEEEGSFLSTQLVDEVRHMQFYARFQDDVIADPGTIAAHVARSREVLGEPFKRIFDQALVQAHDRLLRDPTDRNAKVDFVTIYHMILEGTLGLVTSHFLLDLLRQRELLPGFVDGYSRIAADEQRHIAYGTWFLREAVAGDPAMADVIRERIKQLLPAVAETLSPPSEGAFDALGVDDGALAEFGLGALNRRLALIGAPLDG